MPGAPELVASLSGTIPIAVASNGRGGDVRGLLERAGMLDFFDAIITIDDVDQGKPHRTPTFWPHSDSGWPPRRWSPSRTHRSGHKQRTRPDAR